MKETTPRDRRPYLSVEILCGDGFAFDGTLAAEVDLDRSCAVAFPPFGVNVGVPPLDLSFRTEVDLVLECVKELPEVVGGGREGAVAVGEGDGDDDEVGRREREEDGEDVVDARVRVTVRVRVSESHMLGMATGGEYAHDAGRRASHDDDIRAS